MSPRRLLSVIGIALTLILGGPALAQPYPPIYSVLFTHIEDNTPAGTIPSAQSRQQYLNLRSRLIDMGHLSQNSGIPWSVMPDWKFLRAALAYEDAALMASTSNKNLLRYLREDLGVVIDAHSHENGGYNYTDVAHLLDSLGVGGSTVIGGHIWDPTLPEFQEWDRFRAPVRGLQYPWAAWQGDILMGSGSPFHVNDPVVSGVWRPLNRDYYFHHAPDSNMVAIGKYLGQVDDPVALHDLYVNGLVPPQFMLTTTFSLTPTTLMATGAIAAIEDTIIAPMAAMRDTGLSHPTDFTRLVQAWQSSFGGVGYLYDPAGLAGVGPAPGPGAGRDLRWLRATIAPNPMTATTRIAFTLADDAPVRVAIYDPQGRERAVLADTPMSAGPHTLTWDASGLPAGVWFCRIAAGPGGSRGAVTAAQRLVLVK